MVVVLFLFIQEKTTPSRYIVLRLHTKFWLGQTAERNYNAATELKHNSGYSRIIIIIITMDTVSYFSTRGYFAMPKISRLFFRNKFRLFPFQVILIDCEDMKIAFV